MMSIACNWKTKSKWNRQTHGTNESHKVTTNAIASNAIELNNMEMSSVVMKNFLIPFCITVSKSFRIYRCEMENHELWGIILLFFCGRRTFTTHDKWYAIFNSTLLIISFDFIFWIRWLRRMPLLPFFLSTSSSSSTSLHGKTEYICVSILLFDLFPFYLSVSPIQFQFQCITANGEKTREKYDALMLMSPTRDGEFSFIIQGF